MKAKMIVLVLLAGLMTTGFECISDSYLVSVNIEGITGVYNINPGSGQFAECKTFLAKDYLDQDFGTISGARIYDIRVRTIGNYGGNVNATVKLNSQTGQQILNINGAWSDFNTAQSIITSSKVTRTSAGIAQLVGAIQNKLDITLCGSGVLSGATVPSGLAVEVQVLGQVDGRP